MYPERIKDLYLRGNYMVMIDPERIQRLAARMGNRKDALELVHQMRCGGKKYPDGGKFFRTNLQNESPLMYQPILPSYPDVPTPMRYEPLPHYGLYEYPSTTGMAENYPVTLPPARKTRNGAWSKQTVHTRALLPVCTTLRIRRLQTS